MSLFSRDSWRMPRTLWILAFGTFVNRLGTFVAPFLAIWLTQVKKLSLEDTGFIVSLVGLGQIGAGPVGGFLADRLGRRTALGIATFAGASTMTCLAFARAPLAIASVAFLVGLTGDLYRPVVSAIVADVLPAGDRARGYGILYWAVNLGVSISLVAAGWLADVSFTLLFLLDAATTLLFGAIVVLAVEETRLASEEQQAPHTSIFAPYRDARFLAVCLASTGVAIVMLQGMTAWPIDMRAHGIGNKAYGTICALNAVLVVLLQPLAAARLASASPARVLAAGALLVGFGFSVCALAPGWTPIYVISIAVWTLGEIASAPVMPAVVADLAPLDRRGAYQGAFQLSWGAASFVAPVFGTFVLHRFGSTTLWCACAALGVLCAVAYLALVPSRSAAAPPARAT